MSSKAKNIIEMLYGCKDKAELIYEDEIFKIRQDGEFLLEDTEEEIFSRLYNLRTVGKKDEMSDPTDISSIIESVKSNGSSEILIESDKL